MIRELFLPEKIGDYFLFKKKKVALSIAKNTVTATCMNFHAQKQELVSVYAESIHYEGHEDPTIPVTLAVQKVIALVGKYDDLILVVDSSQAIFKELTVALLDEEKIAQILSFELENYLPFPIQNAVFDFIITSQDITEKKSNIFAVALPQERIHYYINICNQAGITPTKITIDAFNIFSIYQRTKEVHTTNSAQFVITQNDNSTLVLYLENNVLKKIRILQETPDLGNNAWWNAINFTLQSCTQEWQNEIEVVFYCSFNQEFIGQAKMLFNATYTLITMNDVIQTCAITNQSVDTRTHTLSPQDLAATLEFPILQRFNLLPSASFAVVTIKTASKYIVIATLCIGIYGGLALHTFLQIRKFSTISQNVSDKVLKNLKSALPTLKAGSLNEALRKAKSEIAKEEDIWFAFSSQTQHSFLTYLFELSTIIDRETLGLELKKMVFNKNGITLEGKVRSFDAVEEFTKQLKNTNLFTQVPNLQKTEFSMVLPLVNPTANQGERL